MNSVLKSFQYLERLFPPDFVDSVTEESFLYRLLFDKDSRADIWRQNVDDCLELAYRYNLVDTDLEARLKKCDWESWQAAINELKVAKNLEEIFGIGKLSWRPSGKGRRVGEFEIEDTIFTEVKTIFPRELEKLEDSIIKKLRRFAKQMQIPFVLNVSIKEVGDSESFSGKKFKDFLRGGLAKINVGDIEEKPFKLPDYTDDRTGLHLEVEAFPTSKKSCYIGIIGGSELKLLQNEDYIRHSLKHAYKQRPEGKQTFLVILSSSTQFPIDEDDMLNALLGTLAVRVYQSIDSTAKVPEPECFRKLDGFYQPRQNRHLSATGLFQERFLGSSVEEKLEIYHNPFTLNPLNDSLFRVKGVRQLVKKNETEMEWNN